MNHLFSRIVLLGALLLTSNAAAAEPSLMATGDANVLCLVRVNSEGPTYDIVGKESDLPEWHWVEKDAHGAPAAALLSNGQLHMIFAGKFDHVLYNLSTGQRIVHRRLEDSNRIPPSAGPIALAAIRTDDDSNKATRQQTLIAVVARPTAPRPNEALSKKRLMHVGVFRRENGTWSHWIDYPEPVAIGPGERLLAAAVGSDVYVATEASGDEGLLAVLSDGNWNSLDRKGLPAEATPAALLSHRDRLVVLLTGPVEGKKDKRSGYLALYEPAEEQFVSQPIRFGENVMEWSSDQQLMAAPFSERIALLWTEGEVLKRANCGQDGKILAIRDVDVFTRGPADTSGNVILDYFLWGLTFSIIPLMLLRPLTPPKPFTLPPTMKPGNPIKRLLAGLIDLIPWCVISANVFSIEPATERQLREIFSGHAIPANLAYAVVTMLVGYTAYCVFMEHRYGATIGKKIFKLRVIGDDGLRPSLRAILLRNFFRLIELVMTGVPFLLLLPLFTRNRQRLGDIMARTTVIGRTFIPPPPIEQEESAPDDENQADEQQND